LFLCGHQYEDELFNRKEERFVQAFEAKVQIVEKLLAQRQRFGLDREFSRPFFKALELTLKEGACESLLFRVEAASVKTCWPKLQVMTEEQLRFMESLARVTSLGDEGSVPAKSFEALYSFFHSSKRSKQERMEAGASILLLSELARELLDVKSLCRGHQVGILEALDKFAQKLETSESDYLSLEGVSEVREKHGAIKRLKGVIASGFEQLWDCGVWLRRLQKCSRQLLRSLTRITVKVFEGLKHCLDFPLHGIEVLMDLEKLKREDQRFANEWTRISFAKANTDLKHLVNERMQEIEQLMELVKVSSAERLKGLSAYLLDLFQRHEKLYRKSSQVDLLLNRDMRTRFKMLAAEMSKLKVKLSRVHHLELQSMEQQPLKLKGQITYFKNQIPEVMLRGNGREVQLMSKTLGYCYRRIPKILDEDRNVAQSAQEMLTEIVVNSTSLVKELYRRTTAFA
jgi:hypothetical protein